MRRQLHRRRAAAAGGGGGRPLPRDHAAPPRATVPQRALRVYNRCISYIFPTAKANVDAADDDAGAGWRGGWLEQPTSRRPFAEAIRLWMALGPTVDARTAAAALLLAAGASSADATAEAADTHSGMGGVVIINVLKESGRHADPSHSRRGRRGRARPTARASRLDHAHDARVEGRAAAERLDRLEHDLVRQHRHRERRVQLVGEQQQHEQRRSCCSSAYRSSGRLRSSLRDDGRPRTNSSEPSSGTLHFEGEASRVSHIVDLDVAAEAYAAPPSPRARRVPAAARRMRSRARDIDANDHRARERLAARIWARRRVTVAPARCVCGRRGGQTYRA